MNGIPFALQRELKADGYEIQSAAFVTEMKAGDRVELLDVGSMKSAIYEKKTETRTRIRVDGTEYKYKVDTLHQVGGDWDRHYNKMSGSPNASSMTGIVARERKRN